MPNNNLIKVVGYAQAVQYGNGIEYTNFNPDLVGLQLASNGGTSMFTLGNFYITTNMNPKSDKTFITNKFSSFYSLSDLNISTPTAMATLAANTGVTLNLDSSNLNYYALFGSLSEFVRVSLEDIIMNWPASLYLTPIAQTPAGRTITGYTFENYLYNNLSEISTFKVSTTFITNNYQLNYLKSGTITGAFTTTNDLSNIPINYASYAILYNGVEYPVLGFTGSTYATNDYMYLQVQGNVFSGLSSASTVYYHIKPNKVSEEQFYNSLPDFEAYLLNRNVIPPYTATFKYPIKSDTGVILYVDSTLTWPVSDGYNLDFNTSAYINYATALSGLSTDNDSYSSDLVNRFLVADSISAFDTQPVVLSSQDQDNTGGKVNSTLRIYGREFDEINKYITGINFANTVTYNKKDNTPDAYLKGLANVLGWQLVSSVLEQDLIANFVTTAPSTFSGQSVGLTAEQADVELWRRLILNTPWLWKSKGARKSVEFLLKFIGMPNGLVQFNEYIYRARGPIDINVFQEALALNNLSTDLTPYPIDSDGYPSPLANTSSLYFQSNGLWYRETGGSGSTIDILTGNNPHLGPYDGGFAYINQFRVLIPNFSAVTITSQTITTGSANLFTNYNLGTLTNYSGATYVDATNTDGSDLSDCIVVTSEIIPDPLPTLIINNCGCSSAYNEEVLSICVTTNTTNPTNTIANDCANLYGTPSDNTSLGVYEFQYYQYNADGSIYSNLSGPILLSSIYASVACCTVIGGTPSLYNTVVSGIVTNSGYICCDSTGTCGCKIACDWVPMLTPVELPVLSSGYTGSQYPYVVFTKSDGSSGVVTPDGCNCIANYTIAVPNVLDPYTNQIGYGCQLTSQGLSDIALGQSNSVIYNTYLDRSNGKIGCSATLHG